MTHKFKTLFLFSACAAVLSMFTAAADTCANVFAADGNTLADLITDHASCTYGGFTFSNFSYDNNGATGAGTLVTAAGVTVATTSNAYGYGLSFDASWNAPGPGSTSDGDIDFTVTTASGAATIEDSGVAVAGGVSGNGSASVSEAGCSGTSCVPGSWGTLSFASGADTSAGCTAQGGTWNAAQSICYKLASDAIFTPTGSVTVSKDINADGNTTGVASITTVADTFSVVPEPRALSLLLAFGLLGGLVLRKKLQGVKA